MRQRIEIVRAERAPRKDGNGRARFRILERVVVAKMEMQVIADRVELVVFEVRPALLRNRHRVTIDEGRLREMMMREARPQHAHVERRIVRNDDAARQVLRELRPDGRKVGCFRRIAFRDAMNLLVEPEIFVARVWTTTEK